MTEASTAPDRLSGAGVLPDHELRAAVADGWITAAVAPGDEQFQPASLDLRLGPVAYQLRASFLPFRESVQDRLDGEGDLVIDGGNSRYTEDGPHAKLLDDKGIAFIDAGVSGGVWGLKEGYGLMVGGSDADVEQAMPIFDTLRPPGPREDGFVHAGPVGAGHFAKMVHNGIEYALITAYAEGYELLAAEDLVKDPQAIYQAWTNGTVVRSWLQQLLAKALKEDPKLAEITGYTEDSGEGRWTVEEAIRLRVPVPGIAASLFARFLSRQDNSPTMKAVAALRNQFGGHAVKRVSESG